MDNSTISLQELLDCISKLRDDVNALTVAFSYLAFSIPKEQMQPTLASLQGNDSNLLIVFYVQIMPDDFVMQLHRF